MEAFAAAGASEHGVPTIHWSDNETVAAFRAGVQVEYLGKRDKLMRHNDKQWRCIEQFLISSALEHEQKPISVLVYNTHQPASRGRPFPMNARIEFCKSCVRLACEYICTNPQCAGWAILGDPNCKKSSFDAAFAENEQEIPTKL